VGWKLKGCVVAMARHFFLEFLRWNDFAANNYLTLSILSLSFGDLQCDSLPDIFCLILSKPPEFEVLFVLGFS